MKNHPLYIRFLLLFTVIVLPLAIALSYHLAFKYDHIHTSCSKYDISHYSYLYNAFFGGCTNISATMQYLPESLILKILFPIVSMCMGVWGVYLYLLFLKVNKISARPIKRIKQNLTIALVNSFIGVFCLFLLSVTIDGENIGDIYIGKLSIGDLHCLFSYLMGLFFVFAHIHLFTLEILIRRTRITLLYLFRAILLSTLFLMFLTVFFSFATHSNETLISKLPTLEYWLVHLLLLLNFTYLIDNFLKPNKDMI